MADSSGLFVHAGPRITGTGIGDAEWRARVDLAACYRLVAERGWGDLIYTHISLAVPGEPGRFLINPFGLTFDEVTASNLVKIDIDGAIIGDSPHEVNATGFVIHGAVHAAREDARCVMHLHNEAAVSVSMLKDGLLPLSQHALRFYRDLAYHRYEGLALTESEKVRLVANLGTCRAMLLHNHGSLVTGRTVAEAFCLMDMLDKAPRRPARNWCCRRRSCAKRPSGSSPPIRSRKASWSGRRCCDAWIGCARITGAELSGPRSATEIRNRRNGVPMPLINVQLFEGRTPEQKRAYAKALTDASVEVLGCSPEAVDVIFHDVKKSDWASGGKLWSDAE